MVKHICRIDHIPTTLPHNDVITVMEVILSLSSIGDYCANEVLWTKIL